jgi:hypothetical protein
VEVLLSASALEKAELAEGLIDLFKKNYRLYISTETLKVLSQKFPQVYDKILQELNVLCDDFLPLTKEVVQLSLSLYKEFHWEHNACIDIASSILGNCQVLIGYSEPFEKQNLIRFICLGSKGK